MATKPIIADGGIRHHGDIAKSVRFGAAMVMVGSLFAGHEESPGATVEVDGKRYKEYYGSASDFNKGEYKHVEGKRILEPIKGRLRRHAARDARGPAELDQLCRRRRAGRPEEGQLRDPGRRERRRAPVHVIQQQTGNPPVDRRRATMSRSTIRIGIGGWTFEPWRDNFYPKGLAQADELAYAAARCGRSRSTAPTTGSQKPATFAKWRDETPDGFVFSLKASRFVTNRRVLAEAGESIEQFVDSGMTELGDKLGPIVWQFAPTKSTTPTTSAPS